MGIKILQVLRFGPMDMEGINFLSGVPIACVKGRIPVLKSLNLIDENGSTYCINKDGEKFLQALDAKYPKGVRIQVILDNHSAHTSKETRAYLATVPNRFAFVFTPLHGSWLNLIESFFAKMTRQALRNIQVSSKAELVQRLELYLREINEQPVRFRWTHFLPLTVVNEKAI